LKTPKFKQWEIIRYGGEISQVIYYYDVDGVYIYNLKTLQSSEGGIGLTYDKNSRYVDQRYELDNSYMAAKQFDEDLKTLLEDK
jgi:hypothetical protein